MLRRILETIVFSVFPLKCAACDNFVEHTDLGVCCSACWAETRAFGNGESICGKCGALLTFSGRKKATSCGECRDARFDCARAAVLYEAAAIATVIALKKEPHLPRSAQRLIIEGFEKSGLDSPDVIIPMPLSARRRLERGFNQAEIIAEFLSKSLAVPLDGGSLRRHIDSPLHRAGMDRVAREATVKNAFKVVRPKLIANKRILLIDDVLTTGVSASYCASVLKAVGAARVDVFTFARAF